MADSTKIPLSGFQQWMQQMLLDPHGQTDVDPMQMLPAELQAGSLEAVVNDSDRLSAREHLAIYQRSYIARLRDCMAKQFSALEYALGEQLFCGFADNYLELYPSKSYNLMNLGEHFADYLEDTRPDKGAPVKEEWPDFMIELARFEYATMIIFDEKAEEDFVLADENTPEEQMSLIPVFYAFHFQFPIRWFYSEFVNDREPGLPRAQQTFCAMVRRDYKLALFDLNQGQYYLLSYLKGGYTISEAKQLVCDNEGFDADKLEEVWLVWKKRWIQLGFFRLLT
ncbi:MAG: hypothetical protein Roseis2KO_03630 [Roseivirga sp.]